MSPAARAATNNRRAPKPVGAAEFVPGGADRGQVRAAAAYQTLSMLPKRYLAIEHAVRLVLDHLDLDEDVLAQVVATGAAEDVAVSRKISERLSHLLLDGS